jgi:predicted nuclease of restriction endonuclease-like (RecB) superfamily
MSKLAPKPKAPETLVQDLRQIITDARRHAASAVNIALTLLYWRVGDRIRRDVLQNERARYGEQILATLSQELIAEFGRGFDATNLTRMMKFRELDQSLQREFYAEMCRMEGWSVRTLRGRIDSMLYERTALSRKPEELARKELAILKSRGEVGPALVLKDPYILDFLDLRDHYMERDFEDAILRELEKFLLELGAGFSFIARQKRIQLDGEDFYIDLLFYNRKLKRLVAVELKQGSFRAEYKGQMELYLRWLAKYESEDAEGQPLGIILCAGASTRQIELLELDAAGIHVAEYLTVLPPQDVLERKLQDAISAARLRFEIKPETGTL